MSSHSARGREGQVDSFVVDTGPGYLFYVTAVDLSGNESCASSVVRVEGWVTGVEPRPPERHVVRRDLFDIHGRLVRGPPRGSGVYIARILYSDGSVDKRRIVFVK